MAVSMRAVSALSIVLGVSGFLLADDAATTATRKQADAGAQPTSSKKEGRSAESRPVRLTKPWSALASLSDEQRQKINAIHRKAVAEKKAIEEREKSDIVALLDDRQKAELATIEEKDVVDRKAKAGQKPAVKSSAQAPVEADRDEATGAAEKVETKQRSATGSN